MKVTIVQVSFNNTLISDDEQVYLVWIFAGLFLVLSSSGMVTNLVSLRAFLMMGLEDGVTVSFFVLSAADFIYDLSALCLGVVSVMWALEMGSGYKIWFALDPFGLYTIIANISFMLYVMIMLTTVYLAIARCLCVAKPMHFKNSFTKTKSVWILCVFAVFTVGTYLPVLAQMGMEVKLDTRINCTRSLLWITTERELIKVIVWATRDTAISIASQVIIIVCVAVMATTMRKSSEFRKKHTTLTIYTITSDIRAAPNSERKDSRSGRKDSTLVKQTILICVVYIVCNFPKVCLNMAVALEPELTIGKRYQNLSQAGVDIMTSAQMLHSCFNFTIYYRFNARTFQQVQLFIH
ncbi:hypothetical protein Btru_063800 [Bulinus truncatus]|nr:hypothetical protein Btru_063800 [Bulinus truncatus]